MQAASVKFRGPDLTARLADGACMTCPSVSLTYHYLPEFPLLNLSFPFLSSSSSVPLFFLSFSSSFPLPLPPLHSSYLFFPRRVIHLNKLLHLPAFKQAGFLNQFLHQLVFTSFLHTQQGYRPQARQPTCLRKVSYICAMVKTWDMGCRHSSSYPYNGNPLDICVCIYIYICVCVL